MPSRCVLPLSALPPSLANRSAPKGAAVLTGSLPGGGAESKVAPSADPLPISFFFF